MVVIPEQESEYLNGKLAYANQVRMLTILGEGAIIDGKDFDGNAVKKLELPVEFMNSQNVAMKKKWNPNKPAEKALKELFGNDTAKMVGMKVKVFLEKFKDSYSIKVDTVETRALNPGKCLELKV